MQLPGFGELAVVLVIVLIIFGPGKLPQVFEAFGQGMKKFREGARDDRVEHDVTPAAKEIPGRARVEDAEVVEKDHSHS